MAGPIKVNTAQVLDIAQKIEGLNTNLLDQLKEGQTTVKNLANYWEGEAAQATIEAYESFAAKYFQTYHDILDQYVKFLKMNVAQGYFEVETTNTSLSDAFK
ncbi:hypothetical protein PCCS19_51570 [Paenibacillus sp. CCS19]|uniref:WXG100 family type VII secretion target n=1 Tax=Paenibacillus sp. CCS19 TaxID=3158387 RepID=UPI00256D4FC5|nr:WXG100 family type VII secretion target [Paenibacillus cellulosilyticus]GMK42098.1 hypothetical protein PCCS19_51570 [Paenibacillus cellulosilyticus]